MLSPINRFWLLLKPDKKEILQVYAYAIFNGLVSLSLPLGIQSIINFIQGGQISTSWVVLVIFVILGVAFSGVLQILQLSIVENLQQKIFTRAAFEFTYRIPKIKLEALYNKYAPELINRFFDTVSIQKGLSKVLMDFSTASLHVIIGLILLSFYHPFFIFFSFLVIALSYIVLRITSKIGLKSSIIESKQKYNVANWLEEIAKSSLTFKIANNFNFTLGKTNQYTIKYLDARETHFRVLVKQYSMLIVFKVIIAASLLIIGGILVMDQKMNIGQFVASEIIVLLIINSIEKIILSMETIYDILTSLEKVGEITDIELDQTGGIDITKDIEKNGFKIELKNLSFAYPDSKKLILNDINLNIHPKTKVCITGKNGSGKSTLLYLIAGLFDSTSGKIIFNELPISNYDINSLRSNIGCCFSKESLFYGSLLENISLGREISTEKIKDALNVVGLTDFIKQLPKGLDSMINSEVAKFPQSFVQKIILARAIIGNPKLLLIEDIFSSIEEIEKRRIIDYLTSDKNDWTLIFSSLDPYIISKCTDTYSIDIYSKTN